MKFPQYPFNALPGLLSDVLCERSQTPKDDAIAAAVLESVSSLVASGVAVHQTTQSGTAPLSSYGVLLAPSGAGKSFHYGPLTAPITQWCATQVAENPVEKHQQEAMQRVWKKHVRQIEKNIQKCIAGGDDTIELQAELAQLLMQKPRPAILPTLLQDDATMPAVLRSLESWPVAGWIIDEGGVALSMLRPKDFPLLANLSSGRVIPHSRVGEPRKEIQGYLTTLFMVQPGIFNVFAKKRREDLKASGLAARFLYHLVADEWVGLEGNGDVRVGLAHTKYGEHVTAMLDEIYARVRARKRELPVVRFTSRGKARLDALQRRNLHLMKCPELAYCSDFLAKLSGHIARMAAKNHVFLGREGDVSPELVELADEVCWYHFEAYQWVHHPLAQESQRARDAAALVQSLRDRRVRGFVYRDIGQNAMAMGMTTTRLRSAIAELSIQGRVRMPVRNGVHFVEILPPTGLLDNLLSGDW